MPKIKPGQTKDEWMSECIPIVRDEGKTQEQAVGKCLGMWKYYKNESLIEKIDNILLEKSRNIKTFLKTQFRDKPISKEKAFRLLKQTTKGFKQRDFEKAWDELIDTGQIKKKDKGFVWESDMLDEQVLKYKNLDTMKELLKVFKKAGFNFREVRKKWRAAHDRKAMTWRDEGKAYYWSSLPQPRLEKLGFKKKGPYVGQREDGEKIKFYLWIGDEELVEQASGIINKIDSYLQNEEGITTSDVEQNTAKGSVDVIGPEKRKNKKKWYMCDCGYEGYEKKCPHCGADLS